MTTKNPLNFAEILVCLDGSKYSQAAVEYAAQIAVEHDASLTGVGVIDLPGILRASGPAPIGAMRSDELSEQHHVKEARGIVAQILKDFEGTCREKGIRYSIHSETGTPFREIIEESKFHDFIILGQKTFFRHGVGRERGNTLHRILHNGLTAVFAVPDSVREIKKVLVAYDNSVQATKAIQMFLLLHIWNQCDITLLNVNSDAARAKQLLDRLGEYVGRYGIQPAKVHLRGRPDKAILSYIREHEIDLLVMGAYGKRTASEFVFGSATKSLIDHADIPLFIYH
jgi:nucleotide-binding universal stress UspA family protein